MRPADAGLSPKDKASIKMHAIVFQGHLPRMWKFNNIIEAPEYVHSVGRDISLYNWYRNSNHRNIERWRSGHFNSGGKSRACEMQRLGLGSYVH